MSVLTLQNCKLLQTGCIFDCSRMTSIALISILGSVVFIYGLIAVEAVGHTSISYSAVHIGSILDVVMDTICISVSLKVYDKYYRFCCGKCDSRWKRCCVKLTDQVTRKKELELAEMQKSDEQHENNDQANKQKETKEIEYAENAGVDTLKSNAI